MTFEFKLPDVGEGVAEGTLENWLVEVGDVVTEDTPLAEVETDKALVEVPAPVDGTITELPWGPGDVIPVGETFVVFEVEGEEEPDVEAEPGSETAGEVGDGTADQVEAGSGRVFAAPSTRRLARELGVDLSAIDGTGPGGRITDADVRAAAESEPAEPEPASEGAGTEAQAEGETEANTGTPAEQMDAEPAPPPDVEAADRERTLAAPATRRIAREEGVDLDEVPPVEQRDGEAFVTPEAVREYAEAQRAAQEADTEALAKYEEPEPADRERREPYTGVRRSIGRHMEKSKYTAPHVTHHDEADVTELVETREQLTEAAEERGIQLTYMPFVMKAATAALQEFPYVNASLDEENDEIVKKQYYNVGVATATDSGLMVPVVRDVDEKALLQVASETNELVTKARERSIAHEEMEGGTFTITNVGGIGGEYATPIINYPEVAILALGRIKKKPRVVQRDGDETIEPRHVLTLSLSFDHRVIDGAIGARFTNEIKRYLEKPTLLLLE
jgi:pyruvate dehydrogenase E2 component (dihydrolipoamide acetyltransferase)